LTERTPRLVEPINVSAFRRTAVSRRGLLRQLAGAGTLAAFGRSVHGADSTKPRRITVIGGGIIGASVAMHLAHQGVRVTLLEKLAPASGATSKSFAWLNPWTEDPSYRRLRLASMERWRRLDAALGLGITWGGFLDWTSDVGEAGEVEALAATLDGTAHAVTRIDAAGLRRLAPALDPGPVAAAFRAPFDGHADPVRVTERFLAVARHHGATIRFPCEARAFEVRGGRVSAIDIGADRLETDGIVIACGVDTPALLALLGQRLGLRHAPGILAHSAPGPRVLSAVCDGPHGVEFKQFPDGRIVGTDAENPPPLAVHAAILAGPVDFPNEALRAQHGERILARIAAVFPAARQRPLERLTLGFRPIPSDGMPVVGPVPGVQNAYVVVTHSGVTLAPILGELATAELLGAAPAELLAPFRPPRLLQPI
jgi:glycine/D-amino acid oxidase-like deaminating enzyme